MENIEILQKIGLNEKEASVYLALLELGTATVHPIATKAGIKRPTTYLILDQLQQKGIVSIIPRAKKALYTAESPEKLASDLRKKEELLKFSMPNLLALYNVKKEKPQVQLFEGKEGVRQVYNKIFETDSVWFFGTSSEVLKINPDAWYDFLKKAKEKQFKVRDFLKHTPEDEAYAQSVKNDKSFGLNYQIRFLPPGFDFSNDNAIFGNHIVFFSFRPQVFAVMITSQDIVHSMRVLHELAWRSGDSDEKLNKIKTAFI